MRDFSLIEKINMLMNIIISNPLFLFCSMIGVAVFIFYIISIKKDRKVNKWIFICVWIILLIILLFKYNKIMLSLIDNLFDSVFTTLYFPSLSIYITILLISNFSFFYSIFSRKISSINKNLNFISALILNILLILIIDIVNTKNINIHEELTFFSDPDLLVLMQLSSAVFTSWILLSLLISAHRKLKKFDKKEYTTMPEIVFEDV